MLQSDIELSLPYVTSGLPGIGGALRASAEHFVVEELPLYEAQGDGQHLYVNITKVGLTTKEVQGQLERLFGLKRGEAGFAGMKDKQARTTQTFSLNVGNQPPAFADEAAAKIEANLPVTVNWVRFHRNKLRPGHLLGNRFRIAVTELALPVEEAVSRATAIVAVLHKQGLPNFFGPQRLGRDGNNVRQGMAIVAGEQRRGDRWLQRFLISAYQSYLCNRYLARRVAIGAFDRLLEGDVAKKYATGGMFDVLDLAVEQPRYAAQEISFTAPIYGPKMWAAKGESGAFETTILAESGGTIEGLARVRVEGSRRLGRLLIPDLVVEQEAGMLVVSFSLPKGAFATTVMRELMKVDTSALAAVDQDDEDE
jgi:tRNA pseudouridine13 synthase